MIRSEHCILRYDYSRGRVEPDRLHRVRDAKYLDAARAAVEIYRQGVGEPRQSLHREVTCQFESLGNCPPRRMAAMCKLLDDLGQFRKFRDAAKLRLRLFREAAKFHPIVSRPQGIFDHDLQTVRQTLSRQLGKRWESIEADLFADVIELQILKSFPDDVSAEDLLAAYNLAQTQAAHYRSLRVRVDATQSFRKILQAAKLAGLMHRIEPLRERRGSSPRSRSSSRSGESSSPGESPRSGGTRGYRFWFDGPSSTLRQTGRYGARFAQMLPTMFSVGGWEWVAEIAAPGNQRLRLELSPADGLRSRVQPPADFDSDLEQKVAKAWEKNALDGWTLDRESELMVIGQSVLTPDFILRRQSSRQNQTPRTSHDDVLYLEVVGFWTPEYLQEKAVRLRRFTGAFPQCRWLLVFEKPPSESKYQALLELNLPKLIWQDRQARHPGHWLTVAGLSPDRPE
ncbi:MAG: DUF790 family protein [Planctomycetota bacterium]